jgi:hypothetical protein
MVTFAQAQLSYFWQGEICLLLEYPFQDFLDHP